MIPFETTANIVIGKRYAFVNPNGKRTRLTGIAEKIVDETTVRIIASDGKYHYVNVEGARKARTRKIKPVRNAIKRCEL